MLLGTWIILQPRNMYISIIYILAFLAVSKSFQNKNITISVPFNEEAKGNETFCSSPKVVLNGTLLNMDINFPIVESVKFQLATDLWSAARGFCQMVCENQEWRGPFCSQSKEKTAHLLYHSSCKLSYQPNQTVVSYKHQIIQLHQTRYFPHGSELRFRCTSYGGHFIDGNSLLNCIDGQWDSTLPFCLSTSNRNSFTEELPPAIETTVTGGSWSFGRRGELIVYSGAIIHLDCIFDRRRGQPEWTWTQDYKYITGWPIVEEDKDWKYRLSIYRIQDSGKFTCSTPRGRYNSLLVIVTDLHCPLLHFQPPLRPINRETHIGVNMSLSCPLGYSLIGHSSLVCQDDGTWSSELPSCAVVHCSPLEITDPHLRILNLNNSYNGQANFDCPFGFKLVGEKNIRCQHDCQWSSSVPSCEAISCPAPIAPINGQTVRNSEIHFVGDTVHNSCLHGFVLIGEPVLRCTQSGLWSDATPFCKRACRYPGPPLNGQIIPIKFLYEVGEKVIVHCKSGFVNTGQKSVKCTPQGTWATHFPKCSSYID